MNIKLFIGIALFVLGLALAVVGITQVGDRETQQSPVVAAEENRSPDAAAASSIAIPVFAALSLAIGGLLLGISAGNWKHPRTHLEPGDKVVDPEGYHKMKHV